MSDVDENDIVFNDTTYDINNFTLPNKFTNSYSEKKNFIFYGKDKLTKILLQTIQNVKQKLDVYVDFRGPMMYMITDHLRKEIVDMNMRGIKLRYITEINRENLLYCKQLQKVAILKHLKHGRGGIAISESEFVATDTLSEDKHIPHVIYSNVKEFVAQEQNIFESVWANAVPSEIRIREIEEGVETIETKLLENTDDIYREIKSLAENSDEILIFSEPDTLQLIYNNYFDLYQKVLQKYIKGYHRGIRFITTISNDYSELVKLFMDIGIQIRHIQTPFYLHFAVTNRSFYATIEKIGKDGKMINSMISSNDPIYIHHFKDIFEQTWKNATDAKDIIRDIDNGLDPETIQAIYRSSSAKEIYLRILNSAEKEIMLIFPSSRALIRQEKIGIVDAISKAIVERGVKTMILLPRDEQSEIVIESLKKNCHKNSDFLNIKFIDEMLYTKATILIADRCVSLLLELKDDTKETFFEAIGLSTYITSKATVLSYVSIFENLWKVTKLYQDLSIAHKKLERRDKLQKEFIHIAAHELRNPIQPIIGLSQILRDNSNKFVKEQSELLDIIFRNSKKLEKLSENLLDITRIETDTLHLYKETFNLTEFLEDLVNDYKDAIKGDIYANRKKQNVIDIEFISTNNNLTVDADKDRLSQVVFNLLNNADKFIREKNGDEKGKIVISCEKEASKNFAIVKVQDNGPGIDLDILPQLFTKFVSKSQTGTGLGLFICKSIIETHGGKIWVEDDNENNIKVRNNKSKELHNKKNTGLNKNRGTTMAFSIPLSRYVDKHAELKGKLRIDLSATECPNEKREKKVLLIDDEYDLTITYKVGLEAAGFIVDSFNDSTEALTNFKPNYYDIVLVDILMPKIDGFELYERIRKRDKNIKVCFITVYDLKYDSLKKIYPLSHKKDDEYYIKKPIEMYKLVHNIKGILNQR